jgi:c-di-GMP phosphodiesterase
MVTYNTIYNGFEKLKSFADQHNIQNGNNILIQIFSGDTRKEYLETILKEILSILPDANIVGTTTDGEIIEQKVISNGVVISFSLFENTSIEVVAQKLEQDSRQTTLQFMEKIPNKEEARVGIVFSDGLHSNGEMILKTINNTLPHIVISGGLSGDNANFQKTYLFTQEGFCEDFIIGAFLYNPNLHIYTNISFGWESIGKEFTVTKSDENRVYTLDNISIQDIYTKYLGEDIRKKLPATGIEFPLIVKRSGLKTARAVINKFDDGSLLFAGNLYEGEKVTLGYGNVEEILHRAKSLHQRLQTQPIESTFIYSCMARKRLLGKNITQEISTISEFAPTSGFFTYGEFYNYRSETKTLNNFLNQTMTILALSESENVKNIKCESSNEKEQSNSESLQALFHLINQTTKELHELNSSLEQKVQQEVQKNKEKDLQLIHQTRLAQLGEMISMIAHQWRQPLASIASINSQLKLKLLLGNYDFSSSASQEKFLDFLIQSSDDVEMLVDNLTTTIDDFRNFYKKEKESKDQSINSAITKSYAIIEQQYIQHNIYTDINLQSKFNIKHFESEIVQVILNILKNSLDNFIEKDIQDKKVIVRSNDLADGKVEVTILDNGGGIPAEILPKIFDPYFSTKNEKNGTGLGLYMSLQIVEEHHNGVLEAINKNGGVEFRIILPKEQ